MSRHRVSPNGSLRFDRRFRGVGRIALASGTRDVTLFHAFDRMLTELHEGGYVDVLRAIKSRQVTVQEVYDARRARRLTSVAADLVLYRPLWVAVDAWLPRSARAEASRKRYGTSFKALRERGCLKDGATVQDLKRIDWNALQAIWGRSGADWNRLRAAVSAFLTAYLDGDKFHPFRRDVMKRFPRAREKERVPDLTPDAFWSLVDAAPDHAKAPFVCLVVTGLRVGEYLSLEAEHLMPLTKHIQVPGTKTEGSAAVIAVGEEAWKWVKAAVPSPLRYKWLRIHFKRAAKAVGLPDLRLHDLRHLCGQVLANQGLPEAKIQQAMRHASPAMTRRYTRQRDRGEAAVALDAALFPAVKGA